MIILIEKIKSFKLYTRMEISGRSETWKNRKGLKIRKGRNVARTKSRHDNQVGPDRGISRLVATLT